MGNWREAPTGRFRKLCFNTNIAPADPPSGTAPCVPRLGEKWTVTEIEVRAIASLEGQPDALNALSPLFFVVVAKSFILRCEPLRASKDSRAH